MTATTDILRGLFDSALPFMAIIPPEQDAPVVLDSESYNLKPWPGNSDVHIVPLHGTSKELYCRQLSGIIAEMRRDGSKTVIARTICGSFHTFNPAEMAAEYFRKFPHCLRFAFSTSGNDWWMGATPELLLQPDRQGRFETRALAGTRAAGTTGPWSTKNLKEHSIVVDDITGRLSAMGIECNTGKRTNMRYGNIEHLLTTIHINADKERTGTIVGALHPTPAVGGYPRHKAMERIARIETVPRGYYGGTLTYDTPAGAVTYVILRTVHFDKQNWCIYTGSGVTGDSDACDEWHETAEKAVPLLQALMPCSTGGLCQN